MPRVTVVIPTFNCERFIQRTVESALRQTYRDFEIIVVDDGSTDATETLLAQYEKVLRYIRQKNQGASAARNTALAKATGEFIAYLDADDIWVPEKLSVAEAIKLILGQCIHRVDENRHQAGRGRRRAAPRAMSQAASSMPAVSATRSAARRSTRDAGSRNRRTGYGAPCSLQSGNRTTYSARTVPRRHPAALSHPNSDSTRATMCV